MKILVRALTDDSTCLAASVPVSPEGACHVLQLYESAGNRKDIAYVHGMFALFRQAGDTISRQAGGR